MAVQIDGASNKFILDTDADTYLEGATDDTIKVYVSGAEDLRIAANAINVLSGTTLTIDSGATITNSGTANGFGGADPSSADGDTLGTASAEWSDLYLADGGQILFGNDQEVTLTHSADSGLLLKHTATADDKPINLVLQTGETDMAADDVIGKISWQAPDEGTGTDAILVSAAIQAVAEGNHSSSSNATRLEFMTGSSEAATSQMTVSSGGIVGIGAVPTGDLGVGIHVKTADSGASVNAAGDELVIEGSGDSGMTILSGTSGSASIFFGDSGDNDIAALQYHHGSNYMQFNANAAERVRITGDAGLSTGAETAPDTGPHGICIQGAGDNGNFITFKGDAVAHSFTSIAEADTFVQMAKYDNGQGGLRLRAFTEEHQAINLIAYIDASDARNGEATNQGGAIGLQAYGDTGTDAEALGADDNIFTVASATAIQFIVKGDGELFSNQSATVGTYDNYDDAQLVRAYDLSRGKEMKGLINSKFDKFIKYNQKDLMDARLIGRVKDEKGDYQPTDFVNLTGMSRLHNGAIWQQYEKHERLLEAVYDLAKEAVGEDKANAILEKHEVKRLQ